MAVGVVVISEVVQFGCWEGDVGSGNLECHGNFVENGGFFSAVRILDVQVKSGLLLFDPNLIFPTIDGSLTNPETSVVVSLSTNNPEHHYTILLSSDNTKGRSSLKGAGGPPMLIVRDVFQPHSGLDPACQPIADGIASLTSQQDRLQEELQQAASGEKGAIAGQIKSLNAQISVKKSALTTCIAHHPSPAPPTVGQRTHFSYAAAAPGNSASVTGDTVTFVFDASAPNPVPAFQQIDPVILGKLIS
jgi:hypothetical protein